MPFDNIPGFKLNFIRAALRRDLSAGKYWRVGSINQIRRNIPKIIRRGHSAALVKARQIYWARKRA